MKAEDTVPLRFGQGNVDWQQRINWEELRKKRVARAQQFMAKHGIGAAIIYGHDRRRYLSSVWNHPYGKRCHLWCGSGVSRGLGHQRRGQGESSEFQLVGPADSAPGVSVG